jgi:PhzF family phenazine biosynthesis protein
MEITAHILKAFGKTADGGNPAGVVLDADGLSREQKLNISKQLGFSETAYVSKSQKADFKVEFFTPTDEVDMCGHATIATFYLLFKENLLKPGTYREETLAGVLNVEILADGTVTMDQPLPVFSDLVPTAIVADVFNAPEKTFVVPGLAPQIVSTGLRDILLPVKDRKSLLDLKPDFDKMTRYNKQTNTVGFHAFTLDVLNEKATAHCRNFAPLFGIPEEAATGSSNGALACYLFKNSKLGRVDDLIFEQGYSMGKPSEIVASLEVVGKEIKRVRVGGKAIYLERRTLVI